jgi:hypothetical protein
MGSNVTHQVTEDVPPSLIVTATKARSFNAHHLQLLICRPFDSQETPFEKCKIKYLPSSRFFVFDLTQNTDIDYTTQIQCVEMDSARFFIGTSRYSFNQTNFLGKGAYYIAESRGIQQITGLENKSVIQISSACDEFLTADGKIYVTRRSTDGVMRVKCLEMPQLQGANIVHTVMNGNIRYFVTTKNELLKLQLQHDEYKFLDRIKLDYKSPVAQLHVTHDDTLFALLKNGEVVIPYSGHFFHIYYTKDSALVAKHNITKIRMLKDGGGVVYLTGTLLTTTTHSLDTGEFLTTDTTSFPSLKDYKIVDFSGGQNCAFVDGNM